MTDRKPVSLPEMWGDPQDRVPTPDLTDCQHGYIAASCTWCRPIDVTSCETHREMERALAEMTDSLGNVHPSDLATPNVLDHINRMGQMARVIYVRQRVAALDGSRRVSCGEIWCCGGATTDEHMTLVDRVTAELTHETGC